MCVMLCFLVLSVVINSVAVLWLLQGGPVRTRCSLQPQRHRTLSHDCRLAEILPGPPSNTDNPIQSGLVFLCVIEMAFCVDLANDQRR